MKRSLLVADIGGTSSRFAAFERESDGKLCMKESTWLKTGEVGSFPDLLRALGTTDFPLRLAQADVCVFAVAGPVEQGLFSSPPNIPWRVDLAHASQEFGMQRAVLINDFLAQAFASCSPIGKDARQVLPGTAASGGAIAVLGAGTGLGKAALFPDRAGGYLGAPSEGGHSNFCPESPREFEFQSFVATKLGVEYVVWDTVVSGRGLSLIHEFLSGDALQPVEVAKRFDVAPETLEWAARFYGRVCRNFVLETLALGGVYIAGGVAAKNPILIEHQAFAESFRTSPTHQALLSAIPVYLMDNQESGLWGAAYCGSQELNRT